MTGKVALVTGAASGIGRATALAFARAGAQLALLDIHTEGNQQTASLVQAETRAQVSTFQVDLARVAEIRHAFGQVVDSFGRIDASVHVGGFSYRAVTTEVTEEQWDEMVNTNLRGTFFCCQEALRVMYRQGSGAIVNMSADAAFYPIEGFAVQAAAKGAIVNLTSALAFEAARRGVRVNAVSPGITAVLERTGYRPRIPWPTAVGQTSNTRAALAEQTAAGRYVTPEEVAQTVVFLCSDAASGISGDLVHINAGGYFTLRFPD